MFNHNRFIDTSGNNLIWAGAMIAALGILIAIYPMLLVFIISWGMIFAGISIAWLGFRAQRVKRDFHSFRMQSRVIRWQ
jgi:hypothetical protein